MYKKAWAYLLVIVIVAGAFMGQVNISRAQPTANTVEIVGVVQAINGMTLTVNGLSIDISRAEHPFGLKIGDKVKIEGTQAADGSIMARQVSEPQTGIQPGEGELVGTVDSLNGNTLMVSGQTIDISQAEIKGRLTVGQTVKVEFGVDASGQLVAREVKLSQPVQMPGVNDRQNEDHSEITGTLDQIGDGFIVVAGQRIDTTQAEIKGTLTLGALVKVELNTVTGQAVAREIENEHPAGDDNGNDGRGRGVSGGTSGQGQNDNSNSGQPRPADDGGQHNQGGDNHGGNQGSGQQGGGHGGHDDGGGHH